MFRRLHFQTKVLDALDYYLDALIARKENADRVGEIAAQNPDIGVPVPDFTREAHDDLKAAGLFPSSRRHIPFSGRTDGAGRPVPNITLKVPTGGGKTWLAVKSASKILNRYLGRNVGFILWIVPNEAIYSQTLKNFSNRAHVYRQALERAAAGRVRILTREDRLGAADVENHLCIMVLMLQAANKHTKESLKLFRDRGNVHGFMPLEGAQELHRELLARVPNLDYYGHELMPHIKDSLGNALRIIRPVVVMDEGHRAVSDLAYQTLYGFNPSFVLELTATPKDVRPRRGKNPHPGRYANLLVEITGLELDAESMIKMPMMLDVRSTEDWKSVLLSSVEKLNSLQKLATAYQGETDRHIRPILLVQVERTGKDQRDGSFIHAEDVFEYLMKTGFDSGEVAVKTAERNDLNIPEKQDLLSPFNKVRVIITREALQEGWDCPFAYVLCSLSTRSNANAMTQLVGRILRQPDAEKTGIEELDQCYLFTHKPETGNLMEAIKSGFEQDGLGDLVRDISVKDAFGRIEPRKIYRRDSFTGKKIYLPEVRVDRGDGMEPMDYETDVLCRTDWRDYDPSPVAGLISGEGKNISRRVERIKISGEKEKLLEREQIRSAMEEAKFDPVQAVREISDIVLNPFVGYEIVEKLLVALRERNFDDKSLGVHFRLIIEELRKFLQKEQDARAEAFFRGAVENGDIQFRLRADDGNWKMPDVISTNEPVGAGKLVDESGHDVQKSLFDFVYQSELGGDEREVAVYLDRQEALGWWHRNVAKQHYSLQGWKKNPIYPDFIFSVAPGGKTKKLVVLETKGEFLDGTVDTEYKRELMNFLTHNFDWDNTTPAGTLELVMEGETVVCELVLFSEYETRLPRHFQSSSVRP